MFPISRFRVKGRSMEPGFHEGDFVVVSRLSKPRIGDAVVIDYHGKQMLKRISGIDGEKYFVRGDNQVDGRVFAVKRSAVVGKVWLHVRKR